LTPNPIRRVLSTLRSRQVQCLLMGGQACIPLKQELERLRRQRPR
jgi:hypothetical protein